MAPSKNGKEKLEKVLVIEDDISQQNIIADPIKLELGLDVVCVADGQEAWELATKERYSLIVQDWKVPTLLGVGLLNRFRNDEYYRTVPILVASGYLTSQDLALFNEYPFTAPIEKPFTRINLIRKIRDLRKEAEWYKSQEVKIDTLFRTLTTMEQDSVAPINQLLESSPRPMPLMVGAVRILRQNGKYKEAEKVLRKGIGKHASIPVLNELGKVLLHQGNFSEAKRILLKAYEKSPKNLDRLCDLGSVCLETLETDEASKYFDEASVIDKENKKVIEGKKLVENIDDFFRYSNAASIPSSLGGLLNAIGISFVRSSSFSQGMEHYKSALSYVTDQDDKAKLAYNYGLGYLRWRKPKKALEWFEKSYDWSESFTKAEPYIDKLRSRLGGVSSKSNVIDEPSTPQEPIKDDAKESGLDIINLDMEDLETGFDSSFSIKEESSKRDELGKFEKVDGVSDDLSIDIDDDFELDGDESSGDDEDNFSFMEDADSSDLDNKLKKEFENEVEIQDVVDDPTQDDNLKLLKEICPRFGEVIVLLEEKGIHIPSQFARIADLLNKYGVELFNEGIDIAISKESVAAADVSHILSNLSSNRRKSS